MLRLQQILGGSTVTFGENTGIGTGGEQLVTSEQRTERVVIQADPGNGDNVLIGDSDGQYVVLEPGKSITLPASDPSTLYVKAASGTVAVNYMLR